MHKRIVDRAMFYGAKPDIFVKAKQLRDNMTPTELLLWEKINKNQILGFRFKPQHPIDFFIADFYCHKLKLVVEVDGLIHTKPDQKEYDISRTAAMEDYGIKVIRYTNQQTKTSMEDVLTHLKKICNQRAKEFNVPIKPKFKLPH